MKKSIFLTVLLAAFFVSAAIADPGDTLWTRTYGGSAQDQAQCVQQTTDGGYIVGGFTRSFGVGEYDFYLVKTDDSGDTLWTRTYGGSVSDNGRYVQQTTDGGYIFAGQTRSYGAGSADFWLVKTDDSGDTLWTRTYGGSSGDYGYCVQQTTDGGYIVTGSTSSFGAGSADLYLVKTDDSGNTLWTRTYGGSGHDYARSVQQTDDGGYIIAGYGTSFGAGGYDFYLVKTDDSGDTLWIRTYGGSSDDFGYCVQQITDGGYIITGSTSSFGAGGDDIYLVKTDADGDTLWTRTYGGSEGESGQSVQQTTDGGYIVAGKTSSFGAGNEDVYLIKTGDNGDTLWTRTYGGTDKDYANSVQQTSDGGYIIAGDTYSFTPPEGVNFYLVRVAGEELPAVSIEIVPDDPPVTVPQGGSFGFTGTLTNNTEEPQVVDAWTMAVGPQKETYGPFKIRNDVALDPFETRTADFNQHVPNLAPLGFYTYVAYCGEYPSTVIDSSFFQIEVIAGPAGGATGWVLTGSFDRSDDPKSMPSEFALSGNYPNPFNASTAISYELPTDTHVKLEIYNLFGQKVATVVDGQQEAGYRSVTWEDSEAASGVYFYKLTAGDFTEVKRMTLLR